MAEIGNRKERHADGVEPLDQFEAARHGSGDRLVEARRIGVDQWRMIREFGFQLGQHVGERAAGIVLEMPFGRHDMGDEPVEFARIVDQLREQMAQIPLKEDAADVEDHASANHTGSGHAKAPPEASDGVTLTSLCARDICPGRALSLGAP
jgi:hypothetical protein